LPKKSFVPVGVTVASKVREADDGHRPAARQVLLEIDKHEMV
jgi:hypothetical protein